MNRKAGRKRIAGIGLLCILLPAAALPSSGLNLSFKLSGGYSVLALDDVNRCLQAWVEYHKKEVASYPDWTFSGGKAEKLRGGFDFEVEALLNLSRRWAVGIGSGYSFSEVSESRSIINTVERRGLAFAYGRPTKVSGIPLVISGYYFLPLGPKVQIYVRAGAGWLWAKYINREGVRRSTRRDYTYTSFNSASGRSGLTQGGLGVKYIQDKNLGFFCEASLRKAKVNSLRVENGILYYFEEYSSSYDYWWAKIEGMETAPAGENIRSVRKAVVDFSGFFLKLGFFIRF